jgi:hypothetical protein
MFVALSAPVPCLICGCRLHAVMVGTARINKRSMRFTATLGATAEPCPECGTRSDAMPPYSAFQPVPEHADAIRVYRLRRWPEIVGEAAS